MVGFDSYLILKAFKADFGSDTILPKCNPSQLQWCFFVAKMVTMVNVIHANKH